LPFFHSIIHIFVNTALNPVKKLNFSKKKQKMNKARFFQKKIFPCYVKKNIEKTA